jgi:hypothetical protein
MRQLTAIALPFVAIAALALTSCASTSSDTACAPAESAPSAGAETFTAEVWADNWFALYANGVQVGEDSVPITTERSFNAQCVTFSATYPLTIGLVSKDFVQDDSGLEYIGLANQQMGDGRVILQVKDSTGAVVAATDSTWRGLSIFRAPLNTDCVTSSSPIDDCEREILAEPTGWADPAFDDSEWAAAIEYTSDEVGAKDGYTQISWDPSAKIIWASDLHVDNTILWRFTITG